MYNAVVLALLAGCGMLPGGPGELEVVVTDLATGDALEGAAVEISGQAAQTDADGVAKLQAPSDGEFEIRVEARGHLRQSRVRIDSQKLPAEPIAFGLFATGVSGAVEARIHEQIHEAATPSSPGDVRPDAAKEHAAQGLGTPGKKPKATKKRVEVPDTIRVWRRAYRPGCSSSSCGGGCVDELEIEEYVRGVVPKEWMPTWHEESLRAGAVAARTFAARWASLGGKYECADVDDTTDTQVYDDERVETTDAAVEATTGQVIVFRGELCNSEYSAENGPKTEHGVSDQYCRGETRYGHGRGMCQWGSQRWATNADKPFAWMVKHYYPQTSIQRPKLGKRPKQPGWGR